MKTCLQIFGIYVLKHNNYDERSLVLVMVVVVVEKCPDYCIVDHYPVVIAVAVVEEIIAADDYEVIHDY